jgi:hypothetical protein
MMTECATSSKTERDEQIEAAGGQLDIEDFLGKQS